MSGKAWARENMFSRRAAAPPPSPDGVAAWLAGLQLGPAQKVGALELWPLLHPAAVAEPDLLLPEAMAAGLLVVGEKDGGSVQELTATNRAEKPVILFEGEVLLGARQNRMLAHTIVIAPGATIVVPVGCVEKGRWHWANQGFYSSDSVADSSMRRRSKPAVVAALRHTGEARLDQSALWDQVDRVAACEGVQSPTSDYHEVQRKRAAAEAAFARSLTPMDRQVGLMALREGAMIALDLVGSVGTWKGASGRFVRALAADSRPGIPMPPGMRRATAAEWLASLCSARIQRNSSIGLGQDVTLTNGGLLGSGVWLDARPAHVSAFAN